MSDAFSSAGQADSSAAALSALCFFLKQPTVDLLRRVVGLTPSGTVRLVDKLEREGLVERGPGTDKRSVTITLTEKGSSAARDIASSRLGLLRAALATLPEDERAAFER